MYLVSSAMHTYWNSGDWDLALSLEAEFRDLNSLLALDRTMYQYAGAIQVARGLPVDFPVVSPDFGYAPDALTASVEHFISAMVARSAGDLATAAAESVRSVDDYVQAAGADDDFPTMWFAGVEDSLALGDLATVRRLIDIVESAPPGQRTPLLRGLLARFRALVQIHDGLDVDVENEFVAAEEILTAFSAPYYLARTQLDHARWLQGQGRGAEASLLLADAHETFERLGATPWVEQVRQESALAVD
jgi:hypothetical protein